MATLRQILGANLRQARKVKGWSQTRLAEEAALSLDMIGRIERASSAPSFETIEALAKALGMAPLALFSGQGPKAGRQTQRSNHLNQISLLLSKASDAELVLIERLIAALLGPDAASMP